MSKKRILIVDDNKDILEVVSIVLENHGYEPVLLDSSHNIIERINELKPNVILLDVHLGSIDGRVLCKQIKEIEEHAAIPIILFSANIQHGDNVKEYLCDDFIEKPFEIASFIEMIGKHSNLPNKT